MIKSATLDKLLASPKTYVGSPILRPMRAKMTHEAGALSRISPLRTLSGQGKPTSRQLLLAIASEPR